MQRSKSSTNRFTRGGVRRGLSVASPLTSPGEPVGAALAALRAFGHACCCAVLPGCVQCLPFRPSLLVSLSRARCRLQCASLTCPPTSSEVRGCHGKPPPHIHT